MQHHDPFGTVQKWHRPADWPKEPDWERIGEPGRPKTLEELREHSRAFDQWIADIQAERQARVEREERRETAYYFHGRQGEQLANQLWAAEYVVGVEVGAIVFLSIIGVAAIATISQRSRWTDRLFRPRP